MIVCAREWGFYAWKNSALTQPTTPWGQRVALISAGWHKPVLWVTGCVRGSLQKHLENKAVVRIRIRHPVPFRSLDLGWVKGQDPGSGMKKVRIRDPGPQHWNKETVTLAQMWPYCKSKRDRIFVSDQVRTYSFGSGSTTLCAGRSWGPSPLWPNSFLILS